MDKYRLGNTDLFVTKICFGALTIGPLQGNMSVEQGSLLIEHALNKGINFIDTAQLYDTYKYIRAAMKRTGITPVISSKSYAYSKEQAKESLEEARRELDMDVIDIFMLHEQESYLTMRGHREALEYYMDQKAKGVIRAVGVSTHATSVVNVAADMDEIDIIHPMYNISGLGLLDGTIDEMTKAIAGAKSKGKGIYTMKPLGGGNIINRYDEAIEFLTSNKNIDSIAIGMKSINEIDMNIKKIYGLEIDEQLRNSVSSQNRHLHIEFWCEKCQKCVERCQHDALSFDGEKIVVDDSKCVLCGYCSSVCEAFAIKIF